MTPVFIPLPTNYQLFGAVLIFLGSMATFIAYFHVLADSFEKSTLQGVLLTLIPWTVVGYLAIPAYALMKFEPRQHRLALTATAILGFAAFMLGIYWSGLSRQW